MRDTTPFAQRMHRSLKAKSKACTESATNGNYEWLDEYGEGSTAQRSVHTIDTAKKGQGKATPRASCAAKAGNRSIRVASSVSRFPAKNLASDVYKKVLPPKFLMGSNPLASQVWDINNRKSPARESTKYSPFFPEFTELEALASTNPVAYQLDEESPRTKKSCDKVGGGGVTTTGMQMRTAPIHATKETAKNLPSSVKISRAPVADLPPTPVMIRGLKMRKGEEAGLGVLQDLLGIAADHINTDGETVEVKRGESPVTLCQPVPVTLTEVGGEKICGVIFLSNGVQTMPYYLFCSQAAQMPKVSLRPVRKVVRKRKRRVVQDFARGPDLLNLRAYLQNKAATAVAADADEREAVAVRAAHVKALADSLSDKKQGILASLSFQVRTEALSFPAVGLKNPSGRNLCYANCAMQFLMAIPIFYRYVLLHGYPSDETRYPVHNGLYMFVASMLGLIEPGADIELGVLRKIHDIATAKDPPLPGSSHPISLKDLMPSALSLWRERRTGAGDDEQQDAEEFLMFLLESLGREVGWSLDGKNVGVHSYFMGVDLRPDPRTVLLMTAMGEEDSKVTTEIGKLFVGKSLSNAPRVLLIKITRTTFDPDLGCPTKSVGKLEVPRLLGISQDYLTPESEAMQLADDIGFEVQIVVKPGEDVPTSDFGLTYWHAAAIIHEGDDVGSGHYVTSRRAADGNSTTFDDMNMRPTTQMELEQCVLLAYVLREAVMM